MVMAARLCEDPDQHSDARMQLMNVAKLPVRAAARVPDEQVARLRDLIYEGPLESVPWQAFLEALRGVTNATRVSIQLHREANAERDVRVAATHPDNTIDWHEVLEVYRRKYIDTDPIRHHRLAPGVIVTLDDCIGSPFREELLASMQIGHMVRSCFSEPGGICGWLQMYGHVPLGPFDKDRDVALLRELLPHLERSLRLYARIMRNQSEKLAYENAISHLAFGSVLVNGDGRVIDCNQVASKLVDKHKGVAMKDGALALASPPDNAHLQQAISNAIRSRREQDEETAVDLVRMRCSCGALLGFLVLPTPSLTFYRGEHTPNVIIYICELEQHAGGRRERQIGAEQLVAKLFKLTKAEARLAVLLADGLSLVEAAAEMNIAESSARNYSKRIYERTGIRGQTDLVRLIYKSVAMLG